MGIQAFVLRGPFTAEDMARFVSVLREIDSADPSKHYELVAVDSAATGIVEAAKLLKEVVPPVAGRVTRFGGVPTDPELWAKALGEVFGRRFGWVDADLPERELLGIVQDLFAQVAAMAGDRP
jgi:hypothetical protein